ncbi:MAG: Rieske 2Fe-2S domain-containing protein [Flavobacteriales bacterium]|nr:Rieske 2Fe-2S domain-containing protein [Flavobacteriales bacterium]
MIEEIATVSPEKATEKKLNPHPNGWFVVAFSDNLKKGEVRAICFMDQELVIYRTQSGRAAVSNAYCPHMGAHFAHGGVLKGEELQCPFHGFRFDCEGTCTATGYDTKAPPSAKLKQWTVDEKNGFISVYYDSNGDKPEWELPTMNMDGWTSYLTKEYELKSHPQETTENIVDIGHFSWIHGYSKVTEESETTSEGPVLRVNYGFSRNGKELGRKGDIRVHFHATAYGLGYSYVDTDITELGIKTKSFVLPTPTKDGKIKLLLAMAVKEIGSSKKVHPMAALIPKKLLTRIVLKAGFKAYCKDVEDDFNIWNNKTYILKPPLAKGDGPISLYRKWAKQFYHQQLVNM